jgi:hypothetical protein
MNPPALPPLMPKAAIFSGSASECTRPRDSSAAIMF